jgi:hypothetical protein
MNAQTTTIEVDQITAARLQAQADAQGVTLSAWLRSLTESWMATPEQPSFATATPEERARAVAAWANQPRSAAPPLSDDAISRASIYAEREDKQL